MCIFINMSIVLFFFLVMSFAALGSGQYQPQKMSWGVLHPLLLSHLFPFKGIICGLLWVIGSSSLFSSQG